MTDQRLQRAAVQALLSIADDLRRLTDSMDRAEAHLAAIAGAASHDHPGRDPLADDPLADDPAAGAAPTMEGPHR